MIGRLAPALLVALALLAGPALALTSGGRAVVLQPPQPALATNFAGLAATGLCPAPLACSRTSHATMIWPDGHLDYAPNNMVAHADGSSGWVVQSGASLTTGISDPNGGTSAFQIAINNSYGVNSASIAFPAGALVYEVGFWIKPVSTTGTLTVSNPQTSAQGDWTISLSALPNGWTFINRSSPYVTVVTDFSPGSGLGGLYFTSDAVPAATRTVDIYAPSITSQMKRAPIPQGFYPVNLSASTQYFPRYDYTYGSPLLYEEAYSATNLLLQWNGFSSWTVNTYASVASGAATSPDGTTDAWSLTENSTTSGSHYIQQNISKAGSALPYTGCIFAKPNQRSRLVLELSVGANYAAEAIDFGGTGGVASTAQNSVFGAPTVFFQAYANGFYRGCIEATSDTSANISFTAFLDAGTGQGAENDSYAGTVGDGLYVYGATLEQQSFPDSPSPTTTAQVTRAADVAQIPISAIPGFSTNYGTIAMKFIPPTALVAAGAGGRLLGNYGPDAGGGILSYGSTYPTTALIYDSGSSPHTTNNLVQGAINRAVARWTPSTESIVLNSGAIALLSRGSGVWETGGSNGWELATDGGNAVGPMWFGAIRFYSKAVNDNMAQALAAGGF